jgi:sec-independent protein translocase protein TatA
MSGALSPTHWVLIIAVFALLFGARKLPETARGLGQAMRIFKAETAELHSERRDGDRRVAGDASSVPTPGGSSPGTIQPATPPPPAPPHLHDRPARD